MANWSTTIKNMIAEQMKNLNVAFLATILSVSGNKAKIQPLGLTQSYGTEAREQAVITNVHIASSARYKISTKEIEYVTDVGFIGSNVTTKKESVAVATPIKKGDIVLCVCCDRNIDAALKGENSLPPVGYHSKSDCVIVAII